MFELTINGIVYQFKFGMGFVRKVDKWHSVPVDGMPGTKKNIGVRYMLAGLIDGEMDTLVDVLFAANEGFTPRITKEALDQHIDDCEDIDGLFEKVLDFLKNANATKKTMQTLLEQIEVEKAKMKQK